jgi:hypothetical protein
MRKVPLAGAAAAVVLGVAGLVSFATASQAAGPSPAKSQTLVFIVHFSPFEVLHLNPNPDPTTGYGFGDVLTFHDQLFSHGQHAGDEGGSCVIVDGAQVLANCTDWIHLSGGTITTQFENGPPPRKQLAITGGTGIYNTAGGDGTLGEFGNGKGKLTLHVLSLVARGGGA